MRIRKWKKPAAGAADTSRRSFIWKLGAGLSTAVASGAVAATPEARALDDAALRLALLEDEQALRKLHQAFERALDNGRYDEAVELFADDAQVVFNGGVFTNRSQGVSRLFRDRFRAAKTGRRMEPAPGFELAADRQQDRVVVSLGRRSAAANFPYSIQVGAIIEADTSLASMAHLHGEGVRTWWEGGVYNVTYRRDAAGGRWRVSKLEYLTLSRADYRPGRSYAKALTVAPFATRFPEDALGPDDLV